MDSVELVEEIPQKGFWSDKEKELFEVYRNRGYKISFVLGETGCFTIYSKKLNKETIGGMGFLHAPEEKEEFFAMLEFMEDWFSHQGVKRYFAPMDFNTWHTYRIPSSNPENPLFPGEMNYPFHINEWLKEWGMKVVKKYYSYVVDEFEGVLRYLKPGVKRGKKEGLRIEEGKKDIKTMEIVYKISCEAFKKAFLFEKIPFQEFIAMHSEEKNNSILFIAWLDNQPAGFIFGYPWGNTLIEKTVAVLPEYRNIFTGTLLIYQMYLAGLEMGCKRFIHAFMRESISTHIFSRRFGRIYRVYSLYEKELK